MIKLRCKPPDVREIALSPGEWEIEQGEELLF
jgi:hypothetical protein